MTSFGYRSNPRYAIKECSSCGTLYTRDCVCSIGTVEDKTLIPKPLKNCAWCTRCGYLVDGPNCQRCALLRQELEENLVIHSLDFQNSSEPSNASTNVVNAHRGPYVVKQDNGSSVDKIIFDLNRAPDSPNQFHCFHCKDVLRDAEACKRCTCAKCGSGVGKGLCYICGHNQNSLNDSPSIYETSSQSPLNINHCCYECGDPLDGIFCKRCTCKSCGKDAHIGYNCPSKVSVISIPEDCNNQTIDELPQALPIFHLTFHSEAKSPFTLDSNPTYVDESPNIFNPPPQPPREEKRIEEEQVVKAQSWKLPVCYDDDDDEESSNSLEDNIISKLPLYSAVIPTEPIDSLSMADEHLNTTSATESDEFIKSCVQNLIPNPSESKVKMVVIDDQSLSNEDFLKKIYSNPLFDEEIIPIEIDQHSFNAESDLIESIPNHDSSIIISSKIDSLFDEFTGELTLLKSFPPGIDETNCQPEKEIRLTKRLLYDNSSPRPPKEIVSDNSHADIESFFPSPIPNLDSDPLMEEINLPFNPDDPMPLGIGMMIMTLKGIFRSLKNCLTIIPFHSLPMSHTILIFLYLIVVL
nr:hypothetical protein [Tanacetum cinerariifolium]